MFLNDWKSRKYYTDDDDEEEDEEEDDGDYNKLSTGTATLICMWLLKNDISGHICVTICALVLLYV